MSKWEMESLETRKIFMAVDCAQIKIRIVLLSQ